MHSLLDARRTVSNFLSQFHFEHCIYHKSGEAGARVHRWCAKMCRLALDGHTVEPHKFTYGIAGGGGGVWGDAMHNGDRRPTAHYTRPAWKHFQFRLNESISE